MLKKCNDCGVFKSIFNYNKSGRNRRRARCKACYKEYRKVSDFKPESRFNKYKRDAKRRNIPFNLKKEDFFSFENKNCRYCGEKVFPISLDRIDNNIGYDLDNVDSCCSSCNSLKHVLGELDFLNHIKKIYNYQSEKKNE